MVRLSLPAKKIVADVETVSDAGALAIRVSGRGRVRQVRLGILRQQIDGPLVPCRRQVLVEAVRIGDRWVSEINRRRLVHRPHLEDVVAGLEEAVRRSG